MNAAYNVNTHNASERIFGLGFSIEATWTCIDDPWSTPNAPQCLNIGAEAQPGFGSFGFVTGSSAPPFSVQNLDAQSLHVLAAQLQNALNQLQRQQPPAPQPANKLPPGQIVRNPSAFNPANLLPKPDLVAVGISGPTTLQEDAYTAYTATVRNDGADVNGEVEVVITYADPIENIDGDVNSAPGFSCSSTSNYTMDCVGGSLAQGQSATISFNVYAIERPGVGKIQITVNPNHTVAESNVDNNTASLNVTIN